MSATTLPTISASEIPASLLNAQGTILDPVAIKKSSAAKMRLADKTGNVALRKEAAAEQSFADRLGGRTALLSDELKKQIQEQKEAAAKTTEATQEATPEGEQAVVSPSEMKKSRKNKTKQTDAEAPRKPLDSTAQPFQPTKQVQNAALAALNSNFAFPPEAIILKLDAASKQSIADKTGNLILKRTAALEQSLADKMAHVSAPGVTTTALRAGRKGFMLDASIFQAIQPTPTPTPTAAPKQKPQQTSPIQRQQQRQPQRKERSYFNKDTFQSVSPTRADSNMDWRQPSPKQSPTPQRTSPTPQRTHEEVDGADVVTSSPKLDIVEKMKEMEVHGPIINPLAPAPACM